MQVPVHKGWDDPVSDPERIFHCSGSVTFDTDQDQNPALLVSDFKDDNKIMPRKKELFA
jgi:hypothetical protein